MNMPMDNITCCIFSRATWEESGLSIMDDISCKLSPYEIMIRANPKKLVRRKNKRTSRSTKSNLYKGEEFNK